MSERPPLAALPARPRVVIEVPAGGRIKRDQVGRIEFISPVGSPFNYGSAVEHAAPDGDAADVVVLGARLAVGAEAREPLRGRVLFWDVGDLDDKWICSAEPVRSADLDRLDRFFRRYARIKRWAAWARGRAGRTEFQGIELL